MRTIFQNCTLLDGTEQMSPCPGTDVAIENDKKHFIKSLNNDAYLCYYDDKNIYHEEKIEV